MSIHELSRGVRDASSTPLVAARAVGVGLALFWCATAVAVAPEEESALQPRTAAAIRELIDLGRYPQAEAAARELLLCTESSSGEASRAACDARDVLVEALVASGRAREKATRVLAEDAVSIRLRIDAADSLASTAGLTNLGRVLKAHEDYDEAETVLRRALEIRERAYGPDHLEIARTLNDLGAVAVRRRSPDDADALYGRGLEMLEATVGREHPECAVSLFGLSLSGEQRGRVEEARSYLLRAIEIRTRGLGAYHPLVAWALRSLALNRRRAGDYQAAEECLRRALEIMERSLGPDQPLTGAILNPLATQLRRQGDLVEARHLYERALAIFETSLDPWDPWVSGILNNLAMVYRAIGDFSGAEDCLRRALVAREQRFGADHETVAQSLTNLASVLVEAERSAEAAPLSRRAVAIKARVYGPESVEYAISLASLGRVYLNIGELDLAEQSLVEAIAIHEVEFGPDHPNVADLLHNLAMVRHQSGDLDAARDGFQSALGIWRTTLGDKHPFIGRSNYNLARVEADRGEVDEAIDFALKAESHGRAHLQLTARGLAEGEALGFDQYTRNRLDLQLALAIRRPQRAAEVWDALIRSRGMVLNELVGRRRVVDANDPVVSALHDELTVASEGLAKLSLRGPGRASLEAYREALDAARQEVDRLERDLGEASGAFRDDQARSQTGFVEVAESLPPATALVGVTRRAVFPDPMGTASPTSYDYVAMVLAPGMVAPRLVMLGTAPEIDALVLAWRRAAVKAGDARAARSSEESDYRRTGEALRRRIWDPLAPSLKSAEIVFVVPDGELGLVNLAALPVGRFEYLVERGPMIHMLDEERDLVSARDGRNLEGRSLLLALGDPDFDWQETRSDERAGTQVSHQSRGVPGPCGSLDGVVFHRLQSTGPETKKIASLWRECGGSDDPGDGSSPCRRTAVRLTGPEATEAAFKRLAPGKTVLHLATHGFVLDGRCEAGTVTGRGIGGLAPAQPDRSRAWDPVAEPLGLAGLALAGANHRADAGPDEEDGVITAAEIANLDLRGVEWAVLSACDSGVGESVSGEGIFGFRRAFRIAGARTVIMSLWPVEDASGQAWMEFLYLARLRRGMSTAEAVHQAGLEVLHDRRNRGLSTHPFFWGAFVAAGDWR